MCQVQTPLPNQSLSWNPHIFTLRSWGGRGKVAERLGPCVGLLAVRQEGGNRSSLPPLFPDVSTSLRRRAAFYPALGERQVARRKVCLAELCQASPVL